MQREGTLRMISTLNYLGGDCEEIDFTTFERSQELFHTIQELPIANISKELGATRGSWHRY